GSRVGDNLANRVGTGPPRLPRALPNTANLINQPPVASCRRCVRECRDENMGIGAFLPAEPAAKCQICGMADGRAWRVSIIFALRSGYLHSIADNGHLLFRGYQADIRSSKASRYLLRGGFGGNYLA